MFQPFLSLAHVLKFQQFPHWLKAVLLSVRAYQSAGNFSPRGRSWARTFENFTTSSVIVHSPVPSQACTARGAT